MLRRYKIINNILKKYIIRNYHVLPNKAEALELKKLKLILDKSDPNTFELLAKELGSRTCRSIGYKMPLLETIVKYQKNQIEIPKISHIPTEEQLKAVFIQQMFPFIGFGFMDNFIMLAAGDLIDHTFGLWLGISTMAAAGLGNICSDLVGVSFGEVINNLAGKKFVDPGLTVEQLKHSKTRWATILGNSFGLTIGCIIGMIPLLWMENDKKVDHHEHEHEHEHGHEHIQELETS